MLITYAYRNTREYSRLLIVYEVLFKEEVYCTVCNADPTDDDFEAFDCEPTSMNRTGDGRSTLETLADTTHVRFNRHTDVAQNQSKDTGVQQISEILSDNDIINPPL
jgi:hypothetical protein